MPTSPQGRISTEDSKATVWPHGIMVESDIGDGNWQWFGYA